MSLLQLGDAPVMSGMLSRPLRGAWTADLEVDADAAPSGRVTLSGAGVSLVGTVVQSQSWNDRQRCRVVGGAGGMTKTLGATFYRSVTLRSIVTAILASAGEALSPSSSTSVLSRSVPVWVRLRGPAASLLDQVLAAWAPTAIWRVLPDGTVWIGEPAWTTATTATVTQDNRGDEEVAELAGEDLTLDAGTTTQGRKVGLVRYFIAPDSVRGEVFWAGEARGMRATIAKVLEQLVGPRLDALAAYPAKVITQHADGTLDVRPDSPRLPPMTSVPIRYGVPGVSAKVSAGARVLVEFAGGDTSSPVATVWESASVTELSLDATKIRIGGDRNVALEGDSVVVVVDTIMAKAVAALATTVGPPIALAGYIIRTTSSKAKAG